MTKLVLSLATCIVLSVAAVDIHFILGQVADRRKLSHYITFEKENLDRNNRDIIKGIQTTLAFRSSNWVKYFKAFGDLESKSLTTLENDLILLFDHDGTNLDDLQYRSDDIKVTRKRMLECTNQEIKPLYVSLLYQHLFELLQNEVNKYPCEMYIPMPVLIRPVTEDSTYIAWYPYSEEREKFAFRINGQYFQHKHQDYCTIVAQDTLQLETLEISNEGLYIDTTITTQTLAKVDGRWRNVGR